MSESSHHQVLSWAIDLENEAKRQVDNISQLPFIYSHVAVMPDAHAGKGSTIGTVIATEGAIIPAAVGVDIGCGMCAVRLPFKIDAFGDSLSRLRSAIEAVIPVGFNQHTKVTERIITSFQKIYDKPTDLREKLADKAMHQLGTLGGGNHFIEICKDREDNAWVMLHSGSRNLGNRLAEYHINKAKGLMKSYFISLPDPDLAYLTQAQPEFAEYIADLLFAQNYARANRNEMMLRILEVISHHIYKENKCEQFMTSFRVDCHHNYSEIENHFGRDVWITRKGAVSAKKGEYGIIPGSMGAKSYIVKGKGNIESFCSCSHGAGRRMSRTKAKEMFSVSDLINQTAGIECRKDKAVIDEIPAAYKDIDEVMQRQQDLVEIVYELKQLICVKG